MNFFILFICFNLGIWFCANAFGLDRPFFNIDLLIYFYLAYFCFKKTAFFYLYIIFIIEFLLLFSQVFPFFRLNDLIYISKFLLLTSENYILSFVLANIIILFICYKSNTLKFTKESLIIGFIFLSMVYTSSVFIITYNLKLNHIVFSSLIFFKEKQNDTFKEALEMDSTRLTIGKATGVTKKLFEDIQDNKVASDKIMLIINESFGKPKNSLILEDILSPLKKYQEKFDFWNQGAYPYKGATVYGELRDLCRASPNNLNIKNAVTGFEDCLPHQLKNYGFNAISLHGALGIMYDRNQWYLKAGFDELIFRENKKLETRCYSFPGVCDHEFIPLIEEKFKKNKTFIYWLSLNTHINYDIRDLKIDLFNCGKFNIQQNSQSCRNFKLQKQFFYYLSTLLDKPSLKGVEVYLSGDHTPPIHDLDEKKSYFDADNIVWLHFKIKE